MLDKELIRFYLKNKEYRKVSDCFFEQYYNMMYDFLEKSGDNVSRTMTITTLMCIIKSKYPEKLGAIRIISNFLNDEEMSYIDRIDDMLTYYEKVKNFFV
ncbi:MAG: hypothetical protein RSE00_05585 [Clostridia bacterium]